MANHASARTTQVYDRRREEIDLDELERIVIKKRLTPTGAASLVTIMMSSGGSLWLMIFDRPAGLGEISHA
jgi:hypothetical protein